MLICNKSALPPRLDLISSVTNENTKCIFDEVICIKLTSTYLLKTSDILKNNIMQNAWI